MRAIVMVFATNLADELGIQGSLALALKRLALPLLLNLLLERAQVKTHGTLGSVFGVFRIILVSRRGAVVGWHDAVATPTWRASKMRLRRSSSRRRRAAMAASPGCSNCRSTLFMAGRHSLVGTEKGRG